MCTFHGSIFLFCAYWVFLTDPHISKIGSHLLSSIVNYYGSSLWLEKQFISTVVHSVWLKYISINNSKYWYFVMSSWFWAWCKHMREVGRNHVGKGKFMISGWYTWNHLILQHIFLMDMIKSTPDFLSICATKTRWRDEKLFAMSSFHVQGSSSWKHEVWHLSLNKLQKIKDIIFH